MTKGVILKFKNGKPGRSAEIKHGQTVTYKGVQWLAEVGDSLKLTSTKVTNNAPEQTKQAGQEVLREIRARQTDATYLDLQVTNIIAKIKQVCHHPNTTKHYQTHSPPILQTPQLAEELQSDLTSNICASGQHEKRIAELQQMAEIEVKVSETTKVVEVILKPGQVVQANELSSNCSVVWLPLSNEMATVLRTMSIVSKTVTIPLVMPMQLNLLRQWQCPPDINSRCPGGVAVSQDRVWVTCSEQNRVHVFDLYGKLISTWGGQGGVFKFNAPSGVAVLDDSVFVSDSLNHCIQVFKLDGRFVTKWGAEGNPQGLAVCHDEQKLIVCDSQNHCVKIFELDGRFVGYLGQNGTQPGRLPGQFNMPTGVAVSAGHVYVADKMNHRIQVFSTVDWRFVRMFGQAGADDPYLFLPSGVAVKGHELIVSSSEHIRIQVFDTDGKFVKKFQHEECKEHARLAVVGNEVYVCCGKQNGWRVLVFN